MMRTNKMVGLGVLAVSGLIAVGGTALVGPPNFARAQQVATAKPNGPYAATIRQAFDEVEQGLNLTPNQKLRIKAILQKAVPQGRALYNDKSLSPQQKQAKLQALRVATQAKLQQVLTTDQRKKVAALRAAAPERGRAVLKKLATDLQLTSAQQARLKPVLQTTVTQLKALYSDTSLTIGQKLDRLHQIHNKTQGQIQAVLTPAQERKLQAIKAEVFLTVRSEVMQRVRTGWSQ